MFGLRLFCFFNCPLTAFSSTIFIRYSDLLPSSQAPLAKPLYVCFHLTRKTTALLRIWCLFNASSQKKKDYLNWSRPGATSQYTTLKTAQFANRGRLESPSEPCVIAVRTYNVAGWKMAKSSGSSGSSGSSTAVWCLRSDGCWKIVRRVGGLSVPGRPWEEEDADLQGGQVRRARRDWLIRSNFLSK